jgi:hypothetical protein
MPGRVGLAGQYPQPSETSNPRQGPALFRNRLRNIAKSFPVAEFARIQGTWKTEFLRIPLLCNPAAQSTKLPGVSSELSETQRAIGSNNRVHALRPED